MKCVCGCGKKLLKGQRRYYRLNCRYKHMESMLRYGYYPREEVIIKNCPVCGDDYITYIYDKRGTCHQFTGKNCNRKLTGRKNSGHFTGEKSKLLKTKKRPSHILELCQKEPGCKKYAAGFSLDNIDGGCWGRAYYKEDGSCYSPIPMSEFIKRQKYEQMANVLKVRY